MEGGVQELVRHHLQVFARFLELEAIFLVKIVLYHFNVVGISERARRINVLVLTAREQSQLIC